MTFYSIHSIRSNIYMCFVGYDESLGVTLTNRRTVTDFIESVDPIRFLTDVTSIEVLTESDKLAISHPKTTDELKLCMKDIKVSFYTFRVEMMQHHIMRSLCCSEQTLRKP